MEHQDGDGAERRAPSNLISIESALEVLASQAHTPIRNPSGNGNAVVVIPPPSGTEPADSAVARENAELRERISQLERLVRAQAAAVQNPLGSSTSSLFHGFDQQSCAFNQANAAPSPGNIAVSCGFTQQGHTGTYTTNSNTYSHQSCSQLPISSSVTSRSEPPGLYQNTPTNSNSTRTATHGTSDTSSSRMSAYERWRIGQAGTYYDTSSNQASSGRSMVDERYLRPPELPSFSGRPEEWPAFRCMFRATTEEHRVSDLDNLLRLQRCLKGDARKLVESLLIYPHGIPDVLTCLEEAYGRPEQLIRSQIESVRKLQTIGEHRMDEIGPFAIHVRNFTNFLDFPETRHHLANPTLLEELVGKLPFSKRYEWTVASSQIVPYATIKDYSIWLNNVARMINRCIPTSVPAKANRKPVLFCRQEEERNNDNESCAMCSEAHNIKKCVFFEKLTPTKRLEEVKKKRLCFCCLMSDHVLTNCERKKRCGVNGCKYFHCPELHIGTQKQSVVAKNDKSGTVSSPESSNGAVLNCQLEGSSCELLFKIVPVTLFGANNKQINTFAMLDDASSVSMIDAEIAAQIDLHGPSTEIRVRWFDGSSKTNPDANVVSLGIKGRGKSCKRYELENVHTVPRLDLDKQTINRSDLLSRFKHLRGVPFEGYDDACPMLLVGLEHHHLAVPRRVILDESRDEVIATLTKLGWLVYGRNGTSKSHSAIVLYTRREDADKYASLNKLISEHFTTENFGTKIVNSNIESDESRRARCLLEATTNRIGERFETGLLWRDDKVVLPNSLNMAMQRLRSVENKMRVSPSYAYNYREQIAAYVEKGYARKLSDSEAAARHDRTWWLPHFAVQNAKKPGKFRIVFDAAARVGSVSLNSVLMPGPDDNNSLVRILLQFREGRIGVTGDIKEMFHQVVVREVDQDSQRFLWRDDESSNAPDQYVMRVMTFGSTCSPSAAQFVKNVNALEFAAEFPDAAEIVQRRHYVDDMVTSFASSSEAIRITEQVREIHRRGGFDLRGFASNCPEVARSLDANAGEASVRIEPEKSTERVLGMVWETRDDSFRFNTSFDRVGEEVVSGQQRPSKRQILSMTMSIYDPFGFLADFVIESKLIIQELWRHEVGWDDAVPDNVNERWQIWRSTIPQTRLVRVPRCYSEHMFDADDIQLHIFADASEDAFAAVAYWRVQKGNDVSLAFVMGKARCAPIKLLTIPRLELQAAVLASRMLVEIRQCHTFNTSKVCLWSDSATVLKWLRSDQRQYKPFVAFRATEILENSSVSNWHWLPSKMNVADDATRVKKPLTYDPDGRWIRGPEWLCLDETTWPVEDITNVVSDQSAIETRRKYVGVVIARRGCLSTIINYTRFSKYFRLVRMVAWINRFASNALTKSCLRVKGELTTDEVDDAIKSICWAVQRDVFKAEFTSLERGEKISAKSKLFIFMPYVDDDGLLRVHGRTDAASDELLGPEAKRPILMPRNHWVTLLIARHHHERNAHQLTGATIASIREKYCIPGLRSLVLQVQRHCNACRIRNAKPYKMALGQLPKDRMAAYERPFTRTGMDFFGPFAVTIGRRREKRWAALFTCLSVRAVHIELASDLSADACIICIRNLCNVRGVPSLIRCDNGTNFIGARNEIAKDAGFIDPDAIQRELSTRGIRWKFNCPANPEAGGAWERLIQSVKRVLKVLLLEDAPKVETLRAFLIEAANLVNSRPLTNIPPVPDNDEVLTPNHFLIGGPNVSLAPNPEEAEPKCTRRQWRICRDLSRRFWTLWVRDYLPELTLRSKNYAQRPPLKIGDLVLVCDENVLRGRWRRGRIVSTSIGPDGIVRTAAVATSEGLVRRPATKLAVILQGPPEDRCTGPGMSPSSSAEISRSAENESAAMQRADDEKRTQSSSAAQRHIVS